MRFLALIPARYGSTRFPGKPLAYIHGKPMIQHVWERCRQVFGEHCYVATDDERIEEAVRSFGGKVVMTSTTHKSGTDRCAEALGQIEKRAGLKFDVVVNIQGDEPFIAADQLRQIQTCFEDEQTQIATLIKPFGTNEETTDPNTPKVVISKQGYALYFSRSVIPYQRGEEKPQYYKHIGMYAYRTAVLREITLLAQSPLEIAESLEQLRWLENGYRIKTAVTHVESHSIDTPEDLAKALRLFRG